MLMRFNRTFHAIFNRGSPRLIIHVLKSKALSHGALDQCQKTFCNRNLMWHEWNLHFVIYLMRFFWWNHAALLASCLLNLNRFHVLTSTYHSMLFAVWARAMESVPKSCGGKKATSTTAAYQHNPLGKWHQHNAMAVMSSSCVPRKEKSCPCRANRVANSLRNTVWNLEQTAPSQNSAHHTHLPKP